MKFHSLLLLACMSLGSLLSLASDPDAKGFTNGTPQIESMNAMAFSPEGVLFVGDSRRAAIVAIDMSDAKASQAAESIDMKKIDEQIAAMVGTNAEDVQIQDMAVHPTSHTIFLAVHLSDGTPLLFSTRGESLELVSLESVDFAQTTLNNPVEADAKDRRGRDLRVWAISDLAYYKGQVLVSGLSNEEFSSTFRSIPFPFKEDQLYASLEIFHAAHGRYETYAPIKTFMPYEFNGEPHIVASYTCTPLVIFPTSQLKQGAHVKGNTVAELGNRNTPLDIISYKKNDKEYLLLANTSRSLMKIEPEKVASFKDYLTTPVEGNSTTAGLDFIALPYVYVQQLAEYNDASVLMVQRDAAGSLNLQTVSKGRL